MEDCSFSRVCWLINALWLIHSFSVTPLGALSFDVTYRDDFMVTLRSGLVNLQTGLNVIGMTGQLAPTNQTARDDLIDRFLTGQDVQMVAVASSNASSIPLFNAGMRGLILPVVLKGKDLGLISYVRFPSMALAALSAETVQLLADTRVGIANPLGHAPLSIVWMQMQINIGFAGFEIATMITNRLPVSTEVGKPNEFSALVHGEMLLTGDGGAFVDFVRAFLLSQSTVQLSLYGNISLLSNFSLGLVPVANFPLRTEVALTPMNGLTDTTIVAFDVPGNSPVAGLAVVTTVSIVNPSPATVTMGDVVFVLQHDNVTLGQVTAFNLTLTSGVNRVTTIGYLAPSFVSPFGPTPLIPPSVDPEALATAAPFFARSLLCHFFDFFEIFVSRDTGVRFPITTSEQWFCRPSSS
jgi:hypothetical protein